MGLKLLSSLTGVVTEDHRTIVYVSYLLKTTTLLLNMQKWLHAHPNNPAETIRVLIQPVFPYIKITFPELIHQDTK